MLGRLTLLHALKEGLLDGSILVKCTAHEIGRVREVRGIKVAWDGHRLGMSSAVATPSMTSPTRRSSCEEVQVSDLVLRNHGVHVRTRVFALLPVAMKNGTYWGI